MQWIGQAGIAYPLHKLYFFWLPHVGGLSGCWTTSMKPDRKLADIYYSPHKKAGDCSKGD